MSHGNKWYRKPIRFNRSKLPTSSQLYGLGQITSHREPLLSRDMTTKIISHRTFGDALASMVANSLKGEMDLAALNSLLNRVAEVSYEAGGPSAAAISFADLSSIRLRDPACEGLVHAFLNFKGFKALAAHRLAHVLWRENRREVALAIQARCSEVYSVDIHPAAKIGAGKDSISRT